MLAALSGIWLPCQSRGRAEESAAVKPPGPRDFASPGGVGPSRGWYIWQKFDPETWQVEVRREASGESWKAQVLPYASTYRYLAYGARPDELLPGERVNLFFAPDAKSKWGYVCHFQDELSQMQGHNHAWQVRSIRDDGHAFTASLWMGNEKKLADEELRFAIDPKCAKWLGGKQVDEFPLHVDQRLYMTWTLHDDQRTVALIADDASFDAIKAQEQKHIAEQMASEGVAGQIDTSDGTSVNLLVYSTYWAQMGLSFKPGQTVQLRATEKGFRPAGEAVEAKLVSAKTGGTYGSGPTDVVLELQRAEDGTLVKSWGEHVVRLRAK